MTRVLLFAFVLWVGALGCNPRSRDLGSSSTGGRPATAAGGAGGQTGAGSIAGAQTGAGGIAGAAGSPGGGAGTGSNPAGGAGQAASGGAGGSSSTTGGANGATSGGASGTTGGGPGSGGSSSAGSGGAPPIDAARDVIFDEGDHLPNRPDLRICKREWTAEQCCAFLCRCLTHLCSDSPKGRPGIGTCMNWCPRISDTARRCHVYHCYVSISPTGGIKDHDSHCGHAANEVPGGACPAEVTR